MLKVITHDRTNLHKPCLLRPQRRLVQGGRTFFFMMDDGVNATAGAERADSFSEMAVTSVTPLQRRQTQRGGGGGGTKCMLGMSPD